MDKNDKDGGSGSGGAVAAVMTTAEEMLKASIMTKVDALAMLTNYLNQFKPIPMHFSHALPKYKSSSQNDIGKNSL